MSRMGRWTWKLLGISAVSTMLVVGLPVEVRAEEPAKAPNVVQVPNARVPFAGVLSGGQPTREQLKELADAGYKTVINLRGEGELTDWDEQAEVTALGMEYVAIPVASAEELTEEKARAFAAALEKAEAPMLVHCGSGNRVGALYALKAFHVDEATAEGAFAAGEHAGLTKLAPKVREILGLPSEEPAADPR